MEVGWLFGGLQIEITLSGEDKLRVHCTHLSSNTFYDNIYNSLSNLKKPKNNKLIIGEVYVIQSL